MIVLRIEHPVPDFDRWKEVFDDDPLNRKESEVRRYTISRPAGDANRVLIDLEFDQAPDAEAMLERLRELWSRVDVMRDPQATILEVVERAEI